MRAWDPAPPPGASRSAATAFIASIAPAVESLRKRSTAWHAGDKVTVIDGVIRANS